MSDLHIDTHPDLPRENHWEDPAMNDISTPLFYIGGGNIITGRIIAFLLLGKIMSAEVKNSP